MNIERRNKALIAALNNLSEFFDTVQIFVTKHDSGADISQSSTIGSGNMFARITQAKLWTKTQEALLLDQMFEAHEGGEGGEDDENE